MVSSCHRLAAGCSGALGNTGTHFLLLLASNSDTMGWPLIPWLAIDAMDWRALSSLLTQLEVLFCSGGNLSQRPPWLFSSQRHLQACLIPTTTWSDKEGPSVPPYRRKSPGPTWEGICVSWLVAQHSAFCPAPSLPVPCTSGSPGNLIGGPPTQPARWG